MTKIFTLQQFKNLIYNNKSLPNQNFSKDLDQIKYFSWDTLLSYCNSPKHTESIRYIIEIMG